MLFDSAYALKSLNFASSSEYFTDNVLRFFSTSLNSEIGVSNQMAKRITIMIDDDLDKKTKTASGKINSRYIKLNSFSKVINETIRKSIKK